MKKRAKRTRDARLGLRITDAEIEMLREIAEADDLSASHVVRVLIRREHAARFGEQKQPKK